MKHVQIYLLPLLLLLPACRETGPTSESSPVISELMVGTEQMQISRATDGEKTKFENGDEIHLFGFVKSAASAAMGLRYFPDAANYPATGTGLTFEFMNTSPIRGHRFGRTVTSADPEVGFWQVGQYHDFVAYYFAGGKAPAEKMPFPMDATGLEREELLWGVTKNWLFTGDATVRPEIKFEHKLSRIRVELVHDMNDIVVGDFVITKLEFQLDKQEREFDVVAGSWADPVGGTGTVILEQDIDDIELKDIDVAEVKRITEEDWWVVPDCTISNFKLHYIKGTDNNGDPYHTHAVVGFAHNDDPLLTTAKTKAGYVTTLRLNINDVKPIIFTADLSDWYQDPDDSREDIIIDENNKVE